MASRAFSARFRYRRRELARVDQRRPCVRRQQRRDLDLLAERRAQQLGGFQNQRIDVDLARLQRLLAGEGEQVLGQLRAALRRLVDHPGDRQQLRVMGDGLGQDADGSGDDGEDIVEVVRHAAGQLADGFHLLRLAELGFGGLLLGQVAADEEVPPDRLGPGPHPCQHHRVAVLVDIARVEVAHLPAAPRRPHLLAGAVEIVRMDELDRAMPDHLFGPMPRMVMELGLT